MLASSGYEALGVDPEAPDEAAYRRIEFEHAELPERVDAVIACTSLHHVTDPAVVVDRIAETLTSGGALVVVEWDLESFDEPTAGWCFERLGPADPEGWLHRLRDEWTASRQEWDAYLQDWAQREGLHLGRALVRLLDQQFDRLLLTYGPYLFPELGGTSEADEQAAIDAGRIRPTRIDYVGRLAVR